MINLFLDTDKKKMWFIGDMLHSDLQFENPHWNSFTDNNQEKVIKSRINIFEELSKPNIIIANSNFVKEAFGYLKKETIFKQRRKKFNEYWFVFNRI